MRALGIDVGGSAVKLAVLAGGGGVPRGTFPHEARGVEALAAAVERALGTLAPEERSLPRGACVAGLVRDGVVVRSGNLGLRDAPLRAALEARTGVLAAFLSDARAVGLAARTEEGDEPVCLALALGTGVGGSLLVGREIVADAGLGHAEVLVEASPVPCAVGHVRCLEAFLGGAALTRAASEAGAPVATAAALDAAAPSDPVARGVLERAGRILGAGVRTTLAARGLARPAVLVLSGGVSGSRALVEAARAELGGSVRVVVSRSGSFTAALGAARAAWDAVNGGWRPRETGGAGGLDRAGF